MDRCCSRLFLTLLVSALVISWAGCVGKSSPNPENLSIQSVTISPAGPLSVDLGNAGQAFTATARNSLGQAVTTTIEFQSSNNAALTIANNGQACAGSWDSLTNPVICTPGTTGVTTVTAVAAGVSSPAVTVYVHPHIDSVVVSQVGSPLHSCFAQGEKLVYEARAFSNKADITNSVGNITWASTNAGVATLDTTLAGLNPNQVETTAGTPGVTNLFASVAGVSSGPFPYTSCLVSYIRLQIQNGSGSSVNLAAGGSKTVVATAVDTLGNVIPKPELTWITSDPEVATASNGTIKANQSAAGAVISASCTPPICNIGVLPALPVYASNGPIPNLSTPGFGAIAVSVTNTKAVTFTAWTATTGCGTFLNCTSAMFSVTTGATPIASTVELPRTPNSLFFSPVSPSATVYVGSDKGLMIVNTSASPATVSTVTNATSPCSLIVCGKILAVSPDGNRVVVSDTVSQPNQVYIYDNAHATNAPVRLSITGASAAAFSPDSLKLFILSDTGQLYSFSTLEALGAVPVSNTVTDVAFSADGSFAYVAGDPNTASISEYSTCSLSGQPSSLLTSGATAASVRRLFPLPDVQVNGASLVQNIVALEPENTPNIELLTTTFTQTPLTGFTCALPTVAGPVTSDFFDLGIGKSFTPLYVAAVGNGSQLIVLAKNVPAVFLVNLSARTVTPVALVNNGMPLGASASPDGSQVFVAACDAFKNSDPTQGCLSGSVHIVQPLNGGDIQQVPYTNINTNNSMCSNLDPKEPPCVADLIAVKPQ